MTSRARISIAFGGKSTEHRASLESFRHVIGEIHNDDSVEIEDIYYVDVEGRVAVTPFQAGLPVDSYVRDREYMPYWAALGRMVNAGTFVLNLLYGNFGEDGKIQGAAAIASVPGSFGPVLAASLAMSKYHMNQYIASAHPVVQIPDTLLLRECDLPEASTRIFDRFHGMEIVVKPNSLGASLFTNRYLVDPECIESIKTNLAEIFEYDANALVQRYVSGTEYSIGCLQKNETVMVLPAVRIETEGAFFGHEEKHRSGKANEIIIMEESPVVKSLGDLSIEIFKSVDFRNMCRFDFIVSPEEAIFFLEANTIPGLMRNSIFPKMLAASDITLGEAISQFHNNFLSERARKSFVDYHID
ncbi:D-alanine--D-alanine ligase [Paraburkholderia caribensis]|uniref:D-alanine--D-alanine ligase n=2 Tax=Paraburkholderia TaxID=1822464 RepID=B2JY45_PARP8|nr:MULTISPECIES: D-alanine--D-alanine ligase [Paraburkholderia]ACC76553.1 D-alanine--D-alanine ligase [Paraburkholderia phymatum STM815]MCO4881997.1 D-alanine--D-alanine ligase [Paraburkholderia caribensis]PTB24577.1 D-alanine--D-alanine ligase [Paraburkholderia caribensis]